MDLVGTILLVVIILLIVVMIVSVKMWRKDNAKNIQISHRDIEKKKRKEGKEKGKRKNNFEEGRKKIDERRRNIKF